MTIKISDSENRYPSCIWIDLSTRRIDEARFDLIANLRFGQHEISIRNGKAIFGLKKGKLKVLLENGEVGVKDIHLDRVFATEISFKIENKQEAGAQIGAKLGGKTEGISANINQASTAGKEYEYKEYQVHTEGYLNDPTWIFQVKTERDILQGLLQNADLATVTLQAKPFTATATFEVMDDDDVYLIDGSLLWQKNITQIKIAVLERSIVKRWLNFALQEKPYLSQQVLQNG